MQNLALADLVVPYLLRGQNLGAQHAALSALRLTSWDLASDDFGIVIRGHCEFNGYLTIDTSNGGLRLDAGVSEAAAAYDPAKRTPIFDIRETSVEFSLFVPRAGSAIIAAGATSIGAAGFTPVRNVFNAWDTLPLDPAPSDYPASGFTLDLILKAPSLRPPFLHPAKLDSTGLLEPDPAFTEVELGLPRLLFRIAHGNNTGSQLTFDLVSAGVSSLDDPGDIGVAELITMTPPYAFVGGATDRVFGIGFRSATLDLSNDSTPPAILRKAQVGDDWTGLYMPEVRVFIAPSGARDFAFEAGANELLIGFGPAGGVWGDFEAMLVNQGSGELRIGARFTDAQGNLYGIERTSDTTATARLPAQTQLVVDVSGGRTPYTRKVGINGGPLKPGSAFQIDLTGASPQDIVIDVTDGSDPPVHQVFTVHAERRGAIATLPTPGAAPIPALPATITAPGDTPVIVIASQTATEVVLTTRPPSPDTVWRVDGGAPSAPQSSLSVPLGAGQSHSIQAHRAGTPATPPLDFFFYFDEPPDINLNENQRLLDYALGDTHLSTARAISAIDRRRTNGHQDPIEAFRQHFERANPGTAVAIRGEASFESDNTPPKRLYNYLLARRRAIAVRERIKQAFPGKNFDFTDLEPLVKPPTDAQVTTWVNDAHWIDHGEPRNDWWKTRVTLPSTPVPDDDSTYTVQRPASPPPPPPPVPTDPQPETPATPDWFRSVKLKVRLVRSELIAAELEGEIDIQTASEQKLQATGQLPPGQKPPVGRSLQNGQPLGVDNPADGITKFRLLCQTDPAAGRVTTMISVGADPADKDGLICWGWLPGEQVRPKSIPLTLLGSYLSFWPLMVEAAQGGRGDIIDAGLNIVAVALPATVALSNWFTAERVTVYGVEYLQRDRGPEFEGQLLFDIGIDWSANLAKLVIIDPQHPLQIRYKAIGLRLGNRADDGTPQFALRPIFDSSRGYTIDLARGNALRLIEPLGQILKVLGARMSRTNPYTFEIDIGLGVDLGVVAVDRAGLRVYLDEPKAPELTALAARVDIPGALVGSGYVEIGRTTVDGHEISTIGGQIDLTLRPLSLRVTAALEIATIPKEAGGPATGVYVGLNVVLPVGIPLGSSGLGIFGFRGIFGMHYERNQTIGEGTGVPALAWLKAAEGKPHLLVNPANPGVKLWVPHVDRWAFGLGMLIGTMEGGVIMNLDGTLLLELPGPRVLIMMNARIVTPPPSVDALGTSGGVLAVIEVTPEHFLIGILIEWDIERLIKIVIPVEAVFPFAPHLHKWHIYLGARQDLGKPIEVDVLGIVRGTGYLMFKGDGFDKYEVHKATLPAIQGFGIGLGVAASFTWGDTDIGLYLRVGGGMDAVIGFEPFVLAGSIYVSGELRLFVVSIGADAQLTAVVDEQPDGELRLYIHGEACGHISLLFFDVEGCVDITIAGPQKASKLPQLVDKVSLKSRSPALLAGTGVDRGIDVSLGDAVAQAAKPALDDSHLPIVPIDAIPIIALKMPVSAASGLKVEGLGTDVHDTPGLPSDRWAERGGQKYAYTVKRIVLERIDPATGASAGPAIQGSKAPVVWWTLKSATEPSPVAQLALFTWEPAAATKAIEKSQRLTDTITDRWGDICDGAAPPAEVLWTFRWERMGPSEVGWDLEGIAWPDPEHTRRSTPPQTRLHVHERWRSGNSQLDAQRGIVPALVIGGQVPCWLPPKTTQPAEPVLTIGAKALEATAQALPRLVVGGRGALSATAVPSGRAVAEKDPVHAALVRREEQRPLRISGALHTKVEASLLSDLAVQTSTILAHTQPAVEMVRKLQFGEPISHVELQAALGGFPSSMAASRSSTVTTGSAIAGTTGTGTASAVTTPPRLCQVRLLEAPMLDNGTPVVIGDKSRTDEVKARLDKAGVTHGPLDDVIVIDSGGFTGMDLLVFARRDLVAKGALVVRALDDKGVELGRVVASTADFIPPRALPAHWSDTSGPWVDDIAELLAWQGQAVWPALRINLARQPKAARVEIGVLKGTTTPGTAGITTAQPLAMMVASNPGLLPAYYVGAISAVLESEVTRAHWDTTQIEHETETITEMLGGDQSDNALMYADALYRVTVEWYGARKGDNEKLGSEASPQSQQFWFRTDAIAEANDIAVFTQRDPVPVKLDPWMLVTLPAEGEKSYFGQENVRLVFSTQDIDRLFAAYGKELRIRFQAASARHPVSGGGFIHPFPINAGTLVPVVGSVLSPWEEAAREVVSGTCIQFSEEQVRHSMVDIPIPLEPFTDYLMDVEIVDVGAEEEARGPRIYRRHFSTGGYQTFGHFANSLVAQRPSARHAELGAMQAIRNVFNGRDPQGFELDDQLMQRGIEPLTVPDTPRIVVFWEPGAGGGLPQPAAVLIEATEPLWRTRPYPKQITDDTGEVPTQRWVLEEATYLRVEDKSGAGVVATHGILRAPGMQRALIVLAPGARGKTVRLDLVDRLDPPFSSLTFLEQDERRATLLELPLKHAPWEEV